MKATGSAQREERQHAEIVGIGDDQRLHVQHLVDQRAAAVGRHVDGVRDVRHLQRVVERIDEVAELGARAAGAVGQLRDHHRDAERARDVADQRLERGAIGAHVVGQGEKGDGVDRDEHDAEGKPLQRADEENRAGRGVVGEIDIR